MPDPATCKRCARAAPWLSLWGNLGIGVYKLVVGLLGGSAALIADSAHSLGDVVGSTAILISTRVSSRQPNESHPYGLGKAEFVAAAFVYTLLLFFAAAISWHAVRAMLHPGLAAPHFVTLLGAVVSTLYNYLMFKYAACVGARNHSPAILADAFENRADAISSLACIFGILGALYVHPICDPLAALSVAAIILWNCQEQLREAIKGLMDEGLGEQEVELVKQLALRHSGVSAATAVRTRRTGARYWVDLHLAVQPGLGVPDADAIAAAIRNDIKRYPNFHHVEVFLAPAAASVGPGETAAESFV